MTRGVPEFPGGPGAPGSDDGWVSLPVSEFEMLGAKLRRHEAEHNRLLDEKLELRAAIEQTWRPEVKALRARVAGLEASNERLKAALESSHPHAYPKPGCQACTALGLSGVHDHDPQSCPECSGHPLAQRG